MKISKLNKKNHQMKLQDEIIIQEKVNNENICNDIQICNITIIDYIKNSKKKFKYISFLEFYW